MRAVASLQRRITRRQLLRAAGLGADGALIVAVAPVPFRSASVFG